jgi:hypothetical protein
MSAGLLASYHFRATADPDKQQGNWPLAVKPSYRTLARKARYFTVSNSSESETPNARASR